MRDSAGELADRLHLLALGYLHLERFVLRRIEGEDEETRILVVMAGKHELDRARWIADDRYVHMNGSRSRTAQRRERIAHHRALIGCHQAFERHTSLGVR